ncbi:MAG: metallophosphoesterase family protein [Sphingobium sp.]
MLSFLRRRPSMPAATRPTVGDGLRVYAVGDIHGRDDLLERLLDMIGADHAARPPMPMRLILLGDLVDRGPQSAQVVERVIALARSNADLVLLRGNHEEIFAAAARGDERATRVLLRIGGGATLASYGLDEAQSEMMDIAAVTRWMLNTIPRAHVDFIDALPDQVEIGDYLFVHAGIRPNIGLSAQSPVDLRWIRHEFLDHEGMHPRFIVHGHSISVGVDERPNRIGIDTGAYFSGCLTALCLEGQARWLLETAPLR